MRQNDETKGCARVVRYSDLITAPPPAKDWLGKTTWPGCRKVYWKDEMTDYSMDCELDAAAPSVSSDSS